MRDLLRLLDDQILLSATVVTRLTADSQLAALARFTIINLSSGLRILSLYAHGGPQAGRNKQTCHEMQRRHSTHFILVKMPAPGGQSFVPQSQRASELAAPPPLTSEPRMRP